MAAAEPLVDALEAVEPELDDRELDDRQEINYRPIMKLLVEVGFKGYVGQEFIPTRDPLAGLREAVALCDV